MVWVLLGVCIYLVFAYSSIDIVNFGLIIFGLHYALLCKYFLTQYLANSFASHSQFIWHFWLPSFATSFFSSSSFMSSFYRFECFARIMMILWSDWARKWFAWWEKNASLLPLNVTITSTKLILYRVIIFSIRWSFMFTVTLHFGVIRKRWGLWLILPTFFKVLFFNRRPGLNYSTSPN